MVDEDETEIPAENLNIDTSNAIDNRRDNNNEKYEQLKSQIIAAKVAGTILGAGAFSAISVIKGYYKPKLKNLESSIINLFNHKLIKKSESAIDDLREIESNFNGEQKGIITRYIRSIEKQSSKNKSKSKKGGVFF